MCVAHTHAPIRYAHVCACMCLYGHVPSTHTHRWGAGSVRAPSGSGGTHGTAAYKCSSYAGPYPSHT
jgi:hypothetical protein